MALELTNGACKFLLCFKKFYDSAVNKILDPLLKRTLVIYIQLFQFRGESWTKLATVKS